MPILPLETYLHPTQLLAQPPRGGLHRWWALHTRARAEKSLARRLRLADIGFFLPLLARPRTDGRAGASYAPLFPGYIFVHGDEHDCAAMMDTGYVARRLYVPNQAEIHQDLAGIHRLMCSGLSVERRPPLVAGARARIVTGSLSGLEGKVIRVASSLKLVLEVRFLGQGACVEIPESAVTPLDDVFDTCHAAKA